jgi:hypothetical protein
VNAIARPVGLAKTTFAENRRLGLELYLRYLFPFHYFPFISICLTFLFYTSGSSAVQAVIDDGNEKARLILAQFLDEEFNNLRLVAVEKK